MIELFAHLTVLDILLSMRRCLFMYTCRHRGCLHEALTLTGDPPATLRTLCMMYAAQVL